MCFNPLVSYEWSYQLLWLLWAIAWLMLHKKIKVRRFLGGLEIQEIPKSLLFWSIHNPAGITVYKHHLNI